MTDREYRVVTETLNHVLSILQRPDCKTASEIIKQENIRLELEYNVWKNKKSA